KEKTWKGLVEHALDGWNIGTPPYGYQAHRIAHPVPAEASQGRTKTRLRHVRRHKRTRLQSARSDGILVRTRYYRIDVTWVCSSGGSCRPRGAGPGGGAVTG